MRTFAPDFSLHDHHTIQRREKLVKPSENGVKQKRYKIKMNKNNHN